MKEQLVSQELYDLLKEKGYDIPDKQNECPGEMLINKSGDYLSYVFPTLSLVQKWTREVHKIHIEVCLHRENYYSVFIPSSELGYIYEKTSNRFKKFDTFEQALEEGLKQGLTLIEI